MIRKKAFTLIELLIVVAIIAILAAIAVPNFLEAQTRSKVARIKADMRSIATGLEGYITDFNEYPPDFKQLQEIGVLAKPVPEGLPIHINSLKALTTPVAYMSSLPKDVFAEKGFKEKEGNIKRTQPDCFMYRALSLAVGDLNLGAETDCFDRGFRWILQSVGPSKDKTNYGGSGGATLTAIKICAGDQGLYVYDPTNGTTSHGLIIRTNKGEFTGED